MVEDIFGILGTTLAGTFHIEEVIAEGGFGVVYRAEHVAFRAPVALKCLKIPGTISPSASEEFVENFREEAEILFHLSAQIPEVVRPLHADAMTLEDGTFVPYIAMEWVEGKPLDSIIIMREDDGLPPLTLRKVIKMLTPIAHALARAHHFQVPGGAIVSVTHCDLKPENILITEKDNPVRAKVLDFGIAKARDTMRMNVGRITDSEASKPFTPSYGAPEQWVPKRYGQSGPWTDVWGLALTIVECVTGRPPIDGDMHAMMGTCLDKSRRPTPRAEGIDLGEAAEAIFRRALAVDPRERFTDIESMWTAFERAAEMPLSFELERRRRARPTGAEELPVAGAALEFAGLELEEEPASSKRPPRRIHSSVPPDVFDGELPITSGPRSFAPLGDSEAPAPTSVAEFELQEEPASGTPGSRSSFDLDLGESVPSPAMSRPRAAITSGTWAQADLTRSGSFSSQSRSGQQAALPPSVKGGRDAAPPDDGPPGLMHQLRVPLILVGIGLVLTAIDVGLAKAMGGTLSLGPARLRWIAVGIVAIGMIVAFWNLLGERE